MGCPSNVFHYVEVYELRVAAAGDTCRALEPAMRVSINGWKQHSQLAANIQILAHSRIGHGFPRDGCVRVRVAFAAARSLAPCAQYSTWPPVVVCVCACSPDDHDGRPRLRGLAFLCLS